MSRRTQAPKRTIMPDPKYGSQLLAKFMNMIMSDGKKSVAERIIYGALDQIADKGKGDPLEVLDKALDNVRPVVEVKSRRSIRFGAPECAVTPAKQRQLLRIARGWMYVHGRGELLCRFDVIAVEFQRGTPHFHHIRNAFTAT